MLLFLMMIAATAMAIAQPLAYTVERVTTQDGQSPGVAFSIMQDRHGFIWLGTRNGLERYDGHELRPFHNDPLDSTNLSSCVIMAICEDSAGFIWAGTQTDGLYRLDRRTRRMIHFAFDPNSDRCTGSKHIGSLSTDRYGDVWVGTDRGIERYVQSTGRFVRYNASLFSRTLGEYQPTDPS